MTKSSHFTAIKIVKSSIQVLFLEFVSSSGENKFESRAHKNLKFPTINPVIEH